MADIKDRAYKAELARIRVTSATDPANVVTCGQCGRSWDNSVATSLTPAPGARCPFEDMHVQSDADSTSVPYERIADMLGDAGMLGDYVLVFTNVNEEGEPYPQEAEHDNLADALALLADFPNDSIVVTLRKW